MLESTLDIVKGCELQCRELEARGLLKSAGHIYHELEGLASNLRYHRRTIVDMLEYSAGTANLVQPYCWSTDRGLIADISYGKLNKIKKHRDDEALYRSVIAWGQMWLS